MKEGVSPAEQIKWQKKVIGKQLRTIEYQKEQVEMYKRLCSAKNHEFDQLKDRIKELEDECDRWKVLCESEAKMNYKLLNDTRCHKD